MRSDSNYFHRSPLTGEKRNEPVDFRAREIIFNHPCGFFQIFRDGEILFSEPGGNHRSARGQLACQNFLVKVGAQLAQSPQRVAFRIAARRFFKRNIVIFGISELLTAPVAAALRRLGSPRGSACRPSPETSGGEPRRIRRPSDERACWRTG